MNKYLIVLWLNFTQVRVKVLAYNEHPFCNYTPDPLPHFLNVTYALAICQTTINLPLMFPVFQNHQWSQW